MSAPAKPKYDSAWVLAGVTLYVFFLGGPLAIVPAVAAIVSAIRAKRAHERQTAALALGEAFQALAAGRLVDVEAELDVIEATARAPWVARIAAIQRATVHVRRGHLERAVDELDRAIALPVERFARENADYQIQGAHALRAFACASLDRRDEAAREIAWVRERAGASVEALAKASLAEALILARRGEREALAALLARDRDVLLEATHPRERAIVRALQRMLKSRQASVYRMHAPEERAAPGEEPPLADWVAKIAPEAAPFVRVAKTSSVGEAGQGPARVNLFAPPAAHAHARAVMARAPKERAAGSSKGLLLGAFAVGLIATLMGALVIGLLASNGPATGAPSSELGAAILRVFAYGLIGALPIGATAFLVARRVRAHRERARLAAAEARADLASLASAGDPIVAARALHLAASALEREGRFAEALDRASQANARLASQPMKSANEGLLWADAVALRAFLLATLGRGDEARACLATLPPAYPHRGRAVFRARLVELARAGDLAAAAAWVDEHELDLPLSVREELLADLVRAVAAPEAAGAAEIERVREELRASPGLRGWIAAAVPGLLERFEGGESERAAPTRVSHDERESEREAAAEVEAEAALATSNAARRLG